MCIYLSSGYRHYSYYYQLSMQIFNQKRNLSPLTALILPISEHLSYYVIVLLPLFCVNILLKTFLFSDNGITRFVPSFFHFKIDRFYV